MITDPLQLQISKHVLQNHNYEEMSDVRKPYAFYRNAFSVEECSEIKNFWNENDCFVEDQVDENSEWFKYFREKRSRKHMFLDDNIDWLDKKLTHYANEANNQNFFLDISYGIMSKQLMWYRPGDWFQPHDDTNHWDNNFYDRKLTVIIQLSDESEYEGGQTLVGIADKIQQPKHQREVGSILIFPTFVEHEVTEITSGNRLGLICWFTGPKFK